MSLLKSTLHSEDCIISTYIRLCRGPFLPVLSSCDSLFKFLCCFLKLNNNEWTVCSSLLKVGTKKVHYNFQHLIFFLMKVISREYQKSKDSITYNLVWAWLNFSIFEHEYQDHPQNELTKFEPPIIHYHIYE